MNLTIFGVRPAKCNFSVTRDKNRQNAWESKKVKLESQKNVFVKFIFAGQRKMHGAVRRKAILSRLSRIKEYK